ncbi:MAG TPA: 30S ribosomal protein S10 [bacterium]|nr:30S ribosomal protein S10 [Patescibacteria group bacterium]HOC96199.1 30S ribosomal protein S10 [bacterium]HPO11466.1 30S ribosomal protein S10 [bacterium]
MVKEDRKNRIRIKVKAYDSKVVDQATKIIINAVRRSGAEIAGPIPLPTDKKLYTILKSTFINKDAREQFEMKVHKRLIDVWNPTSKTMEIMNSLNLPAGVNIEIKL